MDGDFHWPYHDRQWRPAMRYMLLIYDNEQSMAGMTEAEGIALMQGYAAFTNEIREKGLFHAGDPLQPTSTATTVRVRNGKTQTTDGPFAETHEQLGGYYILDCKDLDEAIAAAAKIPTAAKGSIEVRPIMDMDMEMGG
jgi:hypothetical protein